MKIFEFMAMFYWPLLPITILESLRKARWRKAYSQHGILGLFGESVSSLIGTNSLVFFAPLYGSWSGRDIERLLARWDIDIWGWGFSNEEMFFHVRIEDGAIAQDILLNAGVDLLG